MFETNYWNVFRSGHEIQSTILFSVKLSDACYSAAKTSSFELFESLQVYQYRDSKERKLFGYTLQFEWF